MITLYSMFTPSHRVLKERFFEPTVPPDLQLDLRFFENEGAGTIQDASWRRAILWKVDLILEAIETHWGGIFVFSDVDVQFFGSFAGWIDRTTAQHDLVFQTDAPGPALCTGFFFCRGNEHTRATWQRVRERVRVTEAREDDQASLRKIVWQMPNLRWTCLPPIFCGGGTLTGQQWAPGSELPIPQGVLMHHANFTCGVKNKVLQCEHVRERIAAGKFVSQAEAYERSRMKNDFHPKPANNNTSASSTPAAPLRNVSAAQTECSLVVDYDRILREMAAEPEFHPYSAEKETGEFLSSLIGLLRPAAALELGTYKGFTTVQLIRALARYAGTRLVTIDRCDQRSPKLHALSSLYTFIEGHDLEVIPTLRGEFDLAYIDTTHRYEHTVAEIAAVHTHSPNAVLVLHDVMSCAGVAKAIEEFTAHYSVMILSTPHHPILGWINGIAVLSPKTRAEKILSEQKIEALQVYRSSAAAIL